MARLLMLITLAACAAGVCHADDDPDAQGNFRGRKSYDIGLWGDLPYNAIQASTGIDNLIKDMNSFNLAFTVHDGDIKAGSTGCSNDVYTQFYGYLNRLRAPAAYTPGDNEWVDCDRPAAGGYNSLERLDYIRSLFFTSTRTFGQRKLTQAVQTEPLCLNLAGANVPCSENRRWSLGGVTYVTLNVQGSCNNLCDISPNETEWKARNAANIKWLQTAFQVAKSEGSLAIMIISQADPGFNNFDTFGDVKRDPKTLIQTTSPDGFIEYLQTLRTEVLAFGKPVAYVHGDSHYFRIDKPFFTDTGVRIIEFTRVETPGDHAENNNNDVNWLKVTVDPNNREVFSYTYMVVPGNNKR